VKRIVLASFGDARDEIDRVQLEMELSNKSANGVELVMAPALDAMKMALQAELPRVLLQTHNETAAKAYKLVQSKVAQPRAAAAAAPVKVKQAFDVTDPAAVAWVQAHAAELIDGITDTTREDIKRLIESAFEDQFDVYDLADQIAEVIGDDARAEEIARTETMTASNVGQQDAWDRSLRAAAAVRFGPGSAVSITGTLPAYAAIPTFKTDQTARHGTTDLVATDQTKIGGVAVSTGNGVTGTGVQRVTISSDNTAFTVNAAKSGTWALDTGSSIIGFVRTLPAGCTQTTRYSGDTVGVATGAGTSVNSTTTCLGNVYVNNITNSAVTFRLADKTGTPVIWVGGNADFSIPANSNIGFPFSLGHDDVRHHGHRWHVLGPEPARRGLAVICDEHSSP
jgi:hypothetical protein